MRVSDAARRPGHWRERRVEGACQEVEHGLAHKLPDKDPVEVFTINGKMVLVVPIQEHLPTCPDKKKNAGPSFRHTSRQRASRRILSASSWLTSRPASNCRLMIVDNVVPVLVLKKTHLHVGVAGRRREAGVGEAHGAPPPGSCLIPPAYIARAVWL